MSGGDLISDSGFDHTDSPATKKSLNINDFVMVSKLGKGAFGQVFKVKRNAGNLYSKHLYLDMENTFYAMKIMKK